MNIKEAKIQVLPTSLLKALHKKTGITESLIIAEFLKVPFVLNYSCGLQKI